jgi:hypothetical protein
MPLGQAVPAFSGRQTYVGHYQWTPAYFQRAEETESLFGGRLDRQRAATLVHTSHATFLAADCRHDHVDLPAALPGLIARSWRFGCATVYELRP